MRGNHLLLREGDLASAVAASCAMPYVFASVPVNDGRYYDGGALDRVGFSAWQRWRPGRRALVHWVERTAGRDVQVEMTGHTLVRTPPSGASFLSLGNFWEQVEEARTLTRAALTRA